MRRLDHEGLRAFNVERLYGADTSVDELADAAATFPMMVPRRIVVVLAALAAALAVYGGKALIMRPLLNFSDTNLDAVREMLLHPGGVSGLSDGGAQVTSARWAPCVSTRRASRSARGMSGFLKISNTP